MITTVELLERWKNFYLCCNELGMVQLEYDKNGFLQIRSSLGLKVISEDLGLTFKSINCITRNRSAANYTLIEKIINYHRIDHLISLVIENGWNKAKFYVYNNKGNLVFRASMKLATINLGKLYNWKMEIK